MTARQQPIWVECTPPEVGEVIPHQHIPEWAECSPEDPLLSKVQERWRQYQHCLFAATRFRAE